MNKRAIAQKISSVQNTKKITTAMKMVASSKIKKSQEERTALLDYYQGVERVMRHLTTYAYSSGEKIYQRYVQKKDTPQKAVYIFIGTDRGLCGALNYQLYQAVSKHLDAQTNQESVAFYAFGKRSTLLLKSQKHTILGASSVADEQDIRKLVGHIKMVLDMFDDEKINAVYLAHNSHINAMTQKPHIEKILPIEGEVIEEYKDRGYDLRYDYEPSEHGILRALISRYLEASLLHAISENIASEHAARLMAMKSASDNAEKMVKDLKRDYHKKRQAIITQEISEIAGGADAISSS